MHLYILWFKIWYFHIVNLSHNQLYGNKSNKSEIWSKYLIISYYYIRLRLLLLHIITCCAVCSSSTFGTLCICIHIYALHTAFVRIYSCCHACSYLNALVVFESAVYYTNKKVEMHCSPLTGIGQTNKFCGALSLCIYTTSVLY